MARWKNKCGISLSFHEKRPSVVLDSNVEGFWATRRETKEEGIGVRTGGGTEASLGYGLSRSGAGKGVLSNGENLEDWGSVQGCQIK